MTGVLAGSGCDWPVDTLILLDEVSVDCATLLETNLALILEGVPEGR